MKENNMPNDQQEQPEAEINRFEYSSDGGPRLGPGLRERHTRLVVDLTKNEVSFECFQPSSEVGGELLGTFRAALPAETRVGLDAALAGLDFNTVSGQGGRGFGSSLIRLRRIQGREISETAVASSAFASIKPLVPLTSRLNDLFVLALEHPFEAIRLEVVAPTKAGGAFELVIENPSPNTVALPNLDALAGTIAFNEQPALGVRVAESPPEKPGFTPPPLEWFALPVLSTKPAEAEPHILHPGERVKRVTLPCKALRPGHRYLAQAIYSFYGLPERTQGYRMIRGRALSEMIDVMP